VSLYRSRRRTLRQIQAYATVGLYALADILDLQVTIPGFEGADRVPIDLTFDAGLRFDTTFGVFQVGVSNFLGFVTE
jgi:hypothetical protein